MILLGQISQYVRRVIAQKKLNAFVHGARIYDL